MLPTLTREMAQKIKKGIVHRFFIAGFVALPVFCHAGRIPEPWDVLPKIVNMAFSEMHVGFISRDKSYFVLERTSRRWEHSRDWKKFSELFPTGQSPEPARTIEEKGIGSLVLLRASGNTTFKTKNAYCGEGAGIEHRLYRDGKEVSDHVDPCRSVSSLEKLGDLLFLGTRLDAEYGEYPAQGIVIQSIKDGKLAGRIGEKEGLSGNLVRVIRLDPRTGHLWVASHQGFNEISVDIQKSRKGPATKFQILDTQYFYEGFDEATGKPTILLSPAPQPSDRFASTARLLAIEDTRGFYKAVRDLPPKLYEQFAHGSFGIYVWPEGPFFPEKMNVLVPFILASARAGGENHEPESVQSWAITFLCHFQDQAALDFLFSFQKNNRVDWLTTCLKEFEKAGLLPGLKDL